MRHTAAELIGSRYQSPFHKHRRRQVPEPEPPDAVKDEVTIKTTRGMEGLKEIWNFWEAIAQELGDQQHFFHRPEWYQSYMEALEENPDSVVFHLIRRGGLPAAVLPLRAPRRRLHSLPLRVWEVPHHPHMLLSDFICGRDAADEDLLYFLIQHLRSTIPYDWDMLLLPNVLENSCVERCLARHSPDRIIHEISSHCDFLEYSSYEDFLAAISKNFRGNLRKARNKLAKIPETSFLFVRDQAQLPEAFERFCQIEASGWKGDQGTGTAIQLNARLKAFYRALVDNFGSQDSCQINLLMLGDTCLAGQFCLRSNGTIEVLKIGYDEARAALAPGNLLLEQLIQYCASNESRLTQLNLITGVQWHDDWKPRSEKVSNIWIYNHTARAAALFRFAMCRRALSKMLKGVLYRSRRKGG